MIRFGDFGHKQNVYGSIWTQITDDRVKLLWLGGNSGYDSE